MEKVKKNKIRGNFSKLLIRADTSLMNCSASEGLVFSII
jgi:hypothetical protein